MITYLQRYFSFVLVLSLVAPLWLIGALSDSPSFQHRFHAAFMPIVILMLSYLAPARLAKARARGSDS